METEREKEKVIAPDDSYVSFIDKGATASGKTRIWRVFNRKSGDFLGTVRWYSPWRQYCFFPSGGTVFSTGCMTDINRFIHDRMEERE